MTLKDDIFAHALDLGFDQVGVADPASVEAAGDHFRNFLELGRHGDMDWMERKAEWRTNPKAMWGEVKSVIMVGMNYSPDHDPLDNLIKKDVGNISVYARGKDYHDVLKKRLKQLARHIHRTMDADVKVFVDTAAVMEKPLAAAAGIGWQGKHTNLVSRKRGSWLFLGAIYTTLDLEPSTPHTDRCGTCTACLDACPTKAFPSPRTLDARRCISYLTIESKGPIADEFRVPMGNHIYGCDDCLAACPWNSFSEATTESAYFAKEHLKEPPLDTLLGFDDAAFREFFKGSPIKRTGRDRMTRNVLIATGNSGNVDHLPKVIALLDDESPLVRGMAVWALGQLADLITIRRQSAIHEAEADPHVQDEWAKINV